VSESVDPGTGKVTGHYNLAESRALNLGVQWDHPHANHGMYFERFLIGLHSLRVFLIAGIFPSLLFNSH
jgi:hypothetical protein